MQDKIASKLKSYTYIVDKSIKAQVGCTINQENIFSERMEALAIVGPIVEFFFRAL